MKLLFNYLLKFVLLFIILIIGYVVKLVVDAGALKKIENIHFKYCKTIPEKEKSPNSVTTQGSIERIEGPEDISFLIDSTYALISSDPRDEHQRKTGDLYLYNISTKQVEPLIKESFPSDFYPHGIDVIKKNDSYLISVINHFSLYETRVDLFQLFLTEKKISLLKSFSDSSLTAANDIVLFNSDEFFFTRDFNTQDPEKIKFQQYLRQSTGSLWHYKNGKFYSLQENLFFANGLAYDSENHTFFVSEMLDRSISRYKWDGENLHLEQKLELEDGVDNLSLDKEFIYGAGHPKLLSLKKMRDHREFNAPSVVYQITKDFSSQAVIYRDVGDEIAASSVALKVPPNDILIGSVFDNHFLHCILDSY